MKKVILTHGNKILFPDISITKQQIFDYYAKIASFMLLYVKYHPIVMRRYPEGINRQGFFQKQIGDYFPVWLHRHTIELKKGGKQTLVLLEKREDLLYLANQYVIEFHAWLSSAKSSNKPDKIVFDLDPHGTSLQDLRFVARALKNELKLYKLVPFIMTTGSAGYHIVVPIISHYSFEQIHEFAKYIAQLMAQKYPHICTVEMSLSKRKKRIFIDYLRNSYGQTSIACYSLRANKVAGVATPIRWTELSKVEPQSYTIKNIFKRLSRITDPWEDFFKKTIKLDKKIFEKIKKG